MPVRGRRLQPAAAPHALSLITRFSVSTVKDQRLKIRACRTATQVSQAHGGQTTTWPGSPGHGSQQCHHAVPAWGSALSLCPTGTGWGLGAATNAVQLLTPKNLEEGGVGWHCGTMRPPRQLWLSAGPCVTRAQLNGHNI